MEGQGSVNVMLPVAECFIGKTIHQIDADVLDAGIP